MPEDSIHNIVDAQIARMLREIQKDINETCNREIDKIWKYYRLIAGGLALIISVGIVFIYFMYGNNLKTIRDTIHTDLSRQVKTEIDEKFRSEI